LRRLCALVVVLASVEFLVATTGAQIRILPARTDFASYYLAGQLTRAHRSPYDPAVLAAAGHALGFEHDQYPFLYPPPFAWAMQPLAHLSYEHARQVWMLLGTVALFAALAMTLRLVHGMASRLGVEDPRFLWVFAAAFVPAALNSTGVHNDIRSGSVGILLFLCLVIAAWALMERRGVVAGLALAAAVVVKLVPLALLPWVWWRGPRRALTVAAGTLALVCAAATAHFGAGIWGDWLHFAVVAPLGAPNGWAHNQSLDAYLLRLFMPGAVIAVPAQVPPAQRILSLVLSLGLAAATGWILWKGGRARGERPADATRVPLELAFLVLALLTLMKITWVHTLAGMLFVWPVLIATIWRAAEQGAPWSRTAGLAACAGFFLSSAHLPILWGDRLAREPWILLTGAHLAGLVLLWAVSGFLLRHELRAPV
jgi:hypothetical protein